MIIQNRVERKSESNKGVVAAVDAPVLTEEERQNNCNFVRGNYFVSLNTS